MKKKKSLWKYWNSVNKLQIKKIWIDTLYFNSKTIKGEVWNNSTTKTSKLHFKSILTYSYTYTTNAYPLGRYMCTSGHFLYSFSHFFIRSWLDIICVLFKTTSRLLSCWQSSAGKEADHSSFPTCLTLTVLAINLEYWLLHDCNKLFFLGHFVINPSSLQTVLYSKPSL